MLTGNYNQMVNQSSIVCKLLKQLKHNLTSDCLFYQKFAGRTNAEPENLAPGDQEPTGGVGDQNDNGSESVKEATENDCLKNEEQSAEINDGSDVNDKKILSQEIYSIHGN